MTLRRSSNRLTNLKPNKTTAGIMAHPTFVLIPSIDLFFLLESTENPQMHEKVLTQFRVKQSISFTAISVGSMILWRTFWISSERIQINISHRCILYFVIPFEHGSYIHFFYNHVESTYIFSTTARNVSVLQFKK